MLLALDEYDATIFKALNAELKKMKSEGAVIVAEVAHGRFQSPSPAVNVDGLAGHAEQLVSSLDIHRPLNVSGADQVTALIKMATHISRIGALYNNSKTNLGEKSLTSVAEVPAACRVG